MHHVGIFSMVKAIGVTEMVDNCSMPVHGCLLLDALRVCV